MGSGRYLIEAQNFDYRNSQAVFQGGGRNLNTLLNKARGRGVNLIVYGRIVDSSIRQKDDDIGLIKEVFLFGSSTVEIRVLDVATEQEVLVKKVDAFTEDKSYQIQNLTRENKFQLRRGFASSGN